MKAPLLILGAALCGGALLGLAQQTAAPAQAWYTMTFVKAPGDKTAAYEEAVRTQLAKVAQSRVNSGELTFWAHNKLLLPGGSDAKYSHVLVYRYAGIPKLDLPAEETAAQWAKAGVKRSDYIDRMNGLSVVIVKRELWRGLDGAGTVEAGDFIRLDMKKVSNNAQYTNLERTVFKRYWEERIQIGAMKAWGLYALSIPGGEDRPYGFLTMQAFKDEPQMLGPASVPARDSWAKAAPGQDSYNIYKHAAEVSHTTATELWRVIQVARAAR
jgi:hypothetical protein